MQRISAIVLGVMLLGLTVSCDGVDERYVQYLKKHTSLRSFTLKVDGREVPVELGRPDGTAVLRDRQVSLAFDGVAQANDVEHGPTEGEIVSLSIITSGTDAGIYSVVPRLDDLGPLGTRDVVFEARFQRSSSDTRAWLYANRGKVTFETLEGSTEDGVFAWTKIAGNFVVIINAKEENDEPRITLSGTFACERDPTTTPPWVKE